MNRRRISGLCFLLVFQAAFIFFGVERSPALSDVCPDICFPREDYGLFDCQTEREKLCEVILMQGIEFVARNAREKFSAPVVEEGAAKLLGDGGVEFAAKLKKEKRKDKKKEAEKELYVYYSVDGRESWLSKKMRYDPLREEWVIAADIGGGAAGVHYFFRAVDTEGNTYIEIPCASNEFPPKAGCLAPLSPDLSYDISEDFHIEAFLDILDSHVGVNSDSVYITIATHGKIEPGTTLPYRENYFFAAMMNPDRWNEREPYENTSILIYSPMHFLPRDCAMFRRYGAEWGYDTSILDCRVEGDRLHFKAPLNQALGKNQSGYFTVVLGSGQMIGNESGIIKDYTMLTSVRFAERFVKIK